MKNTKRIIGLLLGLIMLFGTVASLSGCGKRTHGEEPVTESTTEESTTEPVTIEEPEFTDIDTTIEPITESTTEEHTTKKTVQSTTKKKSTGSGSQHKTTTKKQTATTKKQTVTTTKKTVPTTKKTEPTTKKNTTQKTTAYSCGYKNHNCTSAAEHDFLVSLEDKGCEICGSHSCPSFYALDEWGQQCYDIKKCPKYSEKDDPCIYCEYCGKKCGLGDNGTCVRFTVDAECPICGKTVKAKTCHSH